MAAITIAFPAPAPRPAAPPALHTGLWTRVRHAIATQRTRRQLLAMDARMLADIGLSRADAMREAARPVWDAGLHR